MHCALLAWRGNDVMYNEDSITQTNIKLSTAAAKLDLFVYSMLIVW